MTLLERWRDQLSKYAEAHRGTAVFGPNHPAVRAAKRYCERTGARWEIGIGGRCELGKRALKQWGHETWANLRARWLIIALPIIALVIWGFSMNVGATLGVLGVILAVIYFAVGFAMGLIVEEAQYEGKSLGDTPGERRAARGTFIATLPVSGLVFVLARPFRCDRFRMVAARAGIVLLALCGIVGIVGIGSSMGWADFLIGVAVAIGVIVAFIGLVEGLSRLAGLIGKLLEACEIREHKMRLKNPVIQAQARASIESALHAYYVANTGHGRSADDEVPYEEWLANLEQMLAKRELGWADVLAEQYFYANYGWLADEPGYDWGFYQLVEGVVEVQRAQRIAKAAARERRRTPVRNALGFVGATLFLMKSKVCPSVILPKMEDVTA